MAVQRSASIAQICQTRVRNSNRSRDSRKRPSSASVWQLTHRKQTSVKLENLGVPVIVVNWLAGRRRLGLRRLRGWAGGGGRGFPSESSHRKRWDAAAGSGASASRSKFHRLRSASICRCNSFSAKAVASPGFESNKLRLRLHRVRWEGEGEGEGAGAEARTFDSRCRRRSARPELTRRACTRVMVCDDEHIRGEGGDRADTDRTRATAAHTTDTDDARRTTDERGVDATHARSGRSDADITAQSASVPSAGCWTLYFRGIFSICAM